MLIEYFSKKIEGKVLRHRFPIRVKIEAALSALAWLGLREWLPSLTPLMKEYGFPFLVKL